MSQNTEDALSQSLAKINANYRSSNDKPKRDNRVQKQTEGTNVESNKMTDDLTDGTESFKEQIFYDLKWNNQTKQELQLVDCEFHHCDFSNADLDLIKAKGCTFHDCNFKNTGLKEALFDKCSFFDSKQQNGCYFYGADLINSQFLNCDISLADFERADMFGIEISHSKAQGCSFKQANFASVISRKKILCSAHLTDSHFRYADFENCQLVGCDLSGSSFVNANFFQSNLENCLLVCTDLSGIQFERLALAGADLRNATLDGLDIRKVDLQGSKINDWQQSVLLDSLGVVCFAN